MTTAVHPFVMFPSRIWSLPGITIQLLKFYEKIFQFWHQGHECFLSNKALMEYAGMQSAATLSAAFTYFEKHGELKRVNKDGKRYIIPPQPRVATETVDNSPENESTPLATARGGSRSSEGGGLATARHNNINIIKQINKKDFSEKNEQKKTDSVDNSSTSRYQKSWKDTKPTSPFADVTKQSTSYDPQSRQMVRKAKPDSPNYQEFVNKFPMTRRKGRVAKLEELLEELELPENVISEAVND